MRIWKKGRKRDRKLLRPEWLFLLFLGVLCFGAGCSLSGRDGTRTPVEFTVVEPEQIPAELAKVIEEHKSEEMQIVFKDKESLYVVRGYGMQETGGYSIAVDECTEGEEKLHVATTLIGPSQADKISREPSYPVIVLKMEQREKEVEFE